MLLIRSIKIARENRDVRLSHLWYACMFNIKDASVFSLWSCLECTWKKVYASSVKGL